MGETPVRIKSPEIIVMVADMDKKGRVFATSIPRSELTEILAFMGRDGREVQYDGRPIDVDERIRQIARTLDHG